MNRFMSIVVAIVAIVAISAPVAAADQRRIVLEFTKAAAPDGTYVGNIDGGGTIKMTLLGGVQLGATQHFSALVEIENSAAGSFTAVVRGVMNFGRGSVALNGTVTSGPLAGAQVHEESQLTDASTGAFEGSISLMPAS